VKTIIVLGMHRSATSLIAKGLHEAGVWMGERLLGASPSNTHGHFENLDFVALNDYLLSQAGGSWDNIPALDRIIEAGAKNAGAIQRTILCNIRQPVWGWKDPRTTLTIPAIYPYIKKYSPVFVPCFRAPKDVAASLEKRNGMHPADGERLARGYNARLLSFLTEFLEVEKFGNFYNFTPSAEVVGGA